MKACPILATMTRLEIEHLRGMRNLGESVHEIGDRSVVYPVGALVRSEEKSAGRFDISLDVRVDREWAVYVHYWTCTERQLYAVSSEPSVAVVST